MIAGFGVFKLRLKSDDCRSRATPNIMKPIRMFMIVREAALKFKWISSMFILSSPWLSVHFFKVFQAGRPHMLDGVYVDMNDGTNSAAD